MTHGTATTPAQLKNVQAIADLELSARQHRSGMDALTDGISRAASHPLFVLAHLALFLFWNPPAETSDPARLEGPA